MKRNKILLNGINKISDMSKTITDTKKCLWNLIYPSYLSVFWHDDTGSLGNREGQQRSLDGAHYEVSVSLDHRVQVIPLRLAAVVHLYLICRHQMGLWDKIRKPVVDVI